MNRALSAVFLCTILFFFTIGSAQNAAAPSAATDTPASQLGSQQLGSEQFGSQASIFGFNDSATQLKWERLFLAVPDPKLAEQHLRTLTSVPHLAGTPEDKATADYVADKFRAAGLETEIVEYKVWMNYPEEISVDAVAPASLKMHGPTPEHVEGDPYQDNPRIVAAVNGYSPSGDVAADLVYANYGRPEDFRKLKEMNVDVRGKIVITRYGQNFRGVKAFVAQQNGAAGLLIYSDPMDDGYFKGDVYPKGPWRPATSVQRGSIGYMFEFPGDATTPGVASLPSLPESQRVPPEKSAALPRIPSTPLSYADAQPLLANLGGPESPREWQGALPFTYHVGPGPVRVKMHLKQNYQFRSIWNVIGRIRGNEHPDEWVVAGNHRDAWVYGAVDPNSGTTAMLESVHGVGELLRSGWKPKRTIVFASWDGEEEGLMGSTEWGEQHAVELANAVAYFNVDVGVSGPNFGASAVPSLKQFIRDITKSVPSPKGGSVYDVWLKSGEKFSPSTSAPTPDATGPAPGAKSASSTREDSAKESSVKEISGTDVLVGDLGSGSDFTVFLQHLGVPSTDIGSSGSYGVYHSVFDNFQWFKKFADPTFVYEQEMARLFGLELLRMADADVLPYDYEPYGKEVGVYIEAVKKKADAKFGKASPNFTLAGEAARRLMHAGAAIKNVQNTASRANPASPSNPAPLNTALRAVERAFLLPQGLPHRSWYRHAIYAPGEYTGYAAVVIPGVNEAIDAGDLRRTEQQLVALANALNLAAKVLENYR